MANITRVDTRRLHGWRLATLRAGRFEVLREFSDRVYGSRDASLAAAKRFRDQAWQRIAGDTRIRRTPPRGTKRGTGIAGVTFESRMIGDVRRSRARASWPDMPRRPGRASFEFRAHGGRNGAVAKAATARKAGIAAAAKVRKAAQQAAARQRLARAGPAPAVVADPRSRKGIRMPPRGRRRRR